MEKLRAPASIAPGTRGRLIFALDATASRQPTWDLACQLQAEMFQEVGSIGGLDVQLVYYRGHECQASRWVSDASTLAGLMRKIDCVTGVTKIGKVLAHTRKEIARQKVQALVFVGDAMEEERADLYAAAGKLGCPVFIFQEGDSPSATKTFQEIARLTRGAHCRFSPGAARELAELLRAVAVYAAGGLRALGAASGAVPAASSTVAGALGMDRLVHSPMTSNRRPRQPRATEPTSWMGFFRRYKWRVDELAQSTCRSFGRLHHEPQAARP